MVLMRNVAIESILILTPVKLMFRPRMFFLHRGHQKPEMMGEEVLLSVPPGEPDHLRGYFY